MVTVPAFTARQSPGAFIRLCNEAVEAISEKLHLASSWEDGNVEFFELQRGLAQWLQRHAPGAFVLIETSGSFSPPCCNFELHPDTAFGHISTCDAYDPDYRLYLVPMSVWEAEQARVLEIDVAWREAQSVCQQKDNEPC